MLTAVRDVVEARPSVTLADVARHVGAPPDAVRGMLDVWVRKGVVRRLPTPCGGCTDCDPATVETYCARRDGTDPAPLSSCPVAVRPES